MESNNGFFNQYGGKYVAEVLRRPLDELEVEFKKAMADPEFVKELETIQRDYIGRETPLLYAETATKLLGGAQIYIKLEGLANTGAHKINNAIGQCLLAKRMGKKRIIEKQVPDSTELQQLLHVQSLTLTVQFIWAKLTFAASSQTFLLWKCTAQKFTL